MKSRILLVVTAGALLSYVDAPCVGEEAEEHIALESVPEAARIAAEKAVDGIKFEEAEVEAVLVYELEGIANGKEVEIEVTSDGQVIATESEADDDDDKDDDAKADAKESDDDAAEAADDGDASEAEGEEEDELEIPLSAVPQSVLDAAKKAVAGFEAKEAEVEPALIYALEGEAKGVEYEVEVTSEGELVEVEKEAE
jgi:hypothetical protein